MQAMLSYWRIDLVNLCLLALLCFLYFYAIYYRFTPQFIYFISAIALIVICIASPLHFLASKYLFSAHMLSHVLLLLIAAPLLVVAIPVENRFKKLFVYISRKVHKTPLVTWIIGVSVMWIWHVPSVFNKLVSMYSMQHSIPSMRLFMSMHIMSLLIAGMFFTWPVINPYRQYRLGSLTSVMYLSSACVFCSLLGLLITFAPAGIYTRYINNIGSDRFLSIIRNKWNISAAADQQMGGLIMWVPCCFIYLSSSMIILIKWFQAKEGVKQAESNYTTLVN